MPFVRSRYPENWKEISLAIRERDGWRCKFCGAENGKPNPTTGSKVVLTVMHLDHNTTNNDPENLAAGCQKCHLTYDAKHHAKNAGETRRRKRRDQGQTELPLDTHAFPCYAENDRCSG